MLCNKKPPLIFAAMKSRDEEAMLAAIAAAGEKLKAATDGAIDGATPGTGIARENVKLAKEAFHEWCRAVDWYMAMRRK